MPRYRQHCPIARTTEVIGESWTPLVLRELSRGGHRFADIAAGVPEMTKPLLAKRLRTLEQAGVVRRLPDDRTGPRYRRTSAGLELRPIIDRLGRWGQSWLPAPGRADLDARVLVRDICREIDARALPIRPVGVQLDLVDAEHRSWWLTLCQRAVTALDTDPGIPITVGIQVTVGVLAQVWLGHSSWLQAVRDRTLMLTGDRAVASAVIGWIGTSPYATVRRAAPETAGGRP